MWAMVQLLVNTRLDSDHLAKINVSALVKESAESMINPLGINLGIEEEFRIVDHNLCVAICKYDAEFK